MPIDSEIQEILNRLLAEIEEPKKATRRSTEIRGRLKISIPKPNFSKLGSNTEFNTNKRKFTSGYPMKIVLPIVLVSVLVLSGFWGRQIVGVLGFPINPAPFTALYFDDPHIAGTGITQGSTLTFGMHNGYPKSKTIKWRASIGDKTFKTGQVEVKPFSSQNVKLRVTKGQPGDFLSISSDALKTPISAVISQ
jgi:hypothetical protein